MKLTHARDKKSSGAKKSGKVGTNEEKRMIINNGSPRPDFPPTDTRSMDAVVNLNERFSRPEKTLRLPDRDETIRNHGQAR